MSFPTIPTAAAGRLLSNTQADTSGTRTFPSLSDLTKNSGDLLLAIIVAYQASVAGSTFGSWGGGFTEFRDAGGTSGMAIGCGYKWSTGSESGTFTVTQATTVTGHAAMFLLSIAGAHPSTVPETGTWTAATTTAADSGSFDPTGWGAEDTLWIGVGGSGETNAGGAYGGITAAPSGYTDYAETGISSDIVGGVEAAVAFKQANAAAEDIGTWSVDLTNARNASVVIAVRPGAATWTSSVVSPFTFGEVVSGIATHLAQVVYPFIFGEVVNGVRTRLGQIVYPTTFDSVTNGVTTRLGQIIAPSTFGFVVDGTTQGPVLPIQFTQLPFRPT